MPLNEEQVAAVQRVLEQPITYLWGPPGTGKTSTIAAAIAALVEHRQRILVVTPSNAAADVLLTQLHASGRRPPADRAGARAAVRVASDGPAPARPARPVRPVGDRRPPARGERRRRRVARGGARRRGERGPGRRRPRARRGARGPRLGARADRRGPRTALPRDRHPDRQRLSVARALAGVRRGGVRRGEHGRARPPSTWRRGSRARGSSSPGISSSSAR